MLGLTWLHLSDWHQKDVRFDPKVVRDRLVKDIEGRTAISPDLAKIDFIVFSGDIASRGQAEEYKAAKKEFFDYLLEASGVSPRRLFIVPGNHDLDDAQLEQLPDEFKMDVISKEEVDLWLEDTQKREQLLSPFEDFKRFVEDYTGQDSPDYSNVQTLKIYGKKIALMGLNSAWWCRRHKNAAGKPNDFGFALVGEPQIHKPLDQILDADLKIAILHHSQEWLAPFDGNRVWSRLKHECDFILHGHGHTPKVTEEHSTAGDCVIIPAGASFARRIARDPQYANSYNFVHIDFETGKGTVFLRRWIDSRTEWARDDETYPEGKFPFNLPGAPADSQRSAALPTVPHQIPPPPQDFTGRGEELQILLNHFERGATITSLRGMGGIGKTALALVLAEKLKSRFPDGQIFLNLQGTSPKPLTIAEAMAHVVRSYRGPDAKIPEDLNGLKGIYHSVLFGKRTLILLDNAVDREQVEPLLPPNGSALLITSRNKFALSGLKERDLNVLPLEDAKKLLVEIEGRIGEHAEKLVKLCGCLPLALRNAAYALKEKQNIRVADYVKRLEDARKRLDLVEASFNLSYELLGPELQRLWCLLSVFPADFDLAGAAAVWDMENNSAEDALGELVKWSLVDFLHATTGEGGRYRMHDLSRVFVDSRQEDDTRGAARHNHAKHYQDLLRKSEVLYLQGGYSLAEGLALFDSDWKNIQAGQRWAKNNTEKSFEIAKICSNFGCAGSILFLRLHPLEYMEWINAALLAARHINNKSAEGTHLGNIGLAYAALGDARRAIEYYEQAIKIFHRTEERQRLANQMNNLGLAYSQLGDPRKALGYHNKALAIARAYGDRLHEGERLGNIGLTYYELGHFRKAIEYHNKALEIAREMKNISGEGDNLGNLGLAYHDLGDVRKAIAYYEQALTISRSIEDSRSEEKDLSNLGLAYLDLGFAKKSIEYFRRALIISRKIGDRGFEGAHLGNIGLAYFSLGETSKSIKFSERTLAICRETGNRCQEGEALRVLGRAFADLKDISKAIDYYEKSLEIVRKIEDRRSEGETLCDLGKAYIDIGFISKANEYLDQSLEIFRKIKYMRGEGEALFNISLAQNKLGNRMGAIDLAKSALSIFEQIESPYAEKAKRTLAEWQGDENPK